MKDNCDIDRMTYSLHTSISDTNVAAINDRMREATLCELEEEFSYAVKMNAHTVTVHPGTICMGVRDTRDLSLECARSSMKVLDRLSAEYGLTVAIENMPNIPVMLGQTASELEYIVDGTNLSICFDIGHANTMNQIDEMIDCFKNRIANVHIHDNNSDKDAHMTIGDGNIDFEYVLSRLKKYSGNYIIESKSLESAILSKSRLEKMF